MPIRIWKGALWKQNLSTFSLDVKPSLESEHRNVEGGNVPPESIGEVRRCASCGGPIISCPVLQCSHCGELRPLRCFCYQAEQNLFVAECVDLDLISEGDTPERAIGGLQQAMHGYLCVAFDGDVEGLILRPSPISHRLRYHWYGLKDRLRRAFSGESQHFAPIASTTWRFSHCR